ncbi:MAG: hypothetical protein JOS17DRAFT_396524 [Linnemannia elongata]|nr:MAG: hypothetical protein JOS17DRAFT_396524 [Linnemannia elongata]
MQAGISTQKTSVHPTSASSLDSSSTNQPASSSPPCLLSTIPHIECHEGLITHPKEPSPSPTETSTPVTPPASPPTSIEITQAVADTSLEVEDAPIPCGETSTHIQGLKPEDLEAAGKGDPAAMNRIGDQYRFGKGIEQDCAAAMEWYIKAGEQGDPKGFYNIAQLYDYALGVPLDYSLAMEWYQKAAAKGYAPAQCVIADLYARSRAG